MLKRGVDFLTVGFWNIEKHNVVREDPTQPFGYAMSGSTEMIIETIVNWYREYKFDVLILAEVTESRGAGQKFAEFLANRLCAVGFPGPRMRGGFRWFENAAGNVGVCNFAYLWDQRVPCLVGLGDRITFEWQPDHVRPTIFMNAGIMMIGGIHAKSVIKEQAAEEILESCHRLDEEGLPAALIGDMNIAFDSVPYFTKRELNEHGWDQVEPRIDPTHVPRSDRYKSRVLDYIWRNGGIAQCIADPPVPQYQMWDMNDHAPIQYHLAVKSGELPFVVI